MKKKVILVDDDEQVLKLTATFLKMLGFEVFKFSNPLNVIDFIETINPKIDLLVTDFDMPWVNGGELIGKMREKKPNIKTICISGSSLNKEFCDASGCDIFLSKPFEWKEFNQAVRRLFPSLPK